MPLRCASPNTPRSHPTHPLPRQSFPELASPGATADNEAPAAPMAQQAQQAQPAALQQEQGGPAEQQESKQEQLAE